MRGRISSTLVPFIYVWRHAISKYNKHSHCPVMAFYKAEYLAAIALHFNRKSRKRRGSGIGTQDGFYREIESWKAFLSEGFCLRCHRRWNWHWFNVSSIKDSTFHSLMTCRATQALAANGARVYITGRRMEALENAAKTHSPSEGGEIIPFVYTRPLNFNTNIRAEQGLAMSPRKKT